LHCLRIEGIAIAFERVDERTIGATVMVLI
jgi:hypothetical protein